MALILIVDDELLCRDLLGKLLRFEGYAVVAAGNGHEALDAVASHKPDMILLDLMMPRMDGWMFLSLLRGHPSWHDLPVIVITAVGEAERVDAAKALGIQDCLFKAQYTLDSLLSRIAGRLAAPSSIAA